MSHFPSFASFPYLTVCSVLICTLTYNQLQLTVACPIRMDRICFLYVAYSVLTIYSTGMKMLEGESV